MRVLQKLNVAVGMNLFQRKVKTSFLQMTALILL